MEIHTLYHGSEELVSEVKKPGSKFCFLTYQLGRLNQNQLHRNGVMIKWDNGVKKQ